MPGELGDEMTQQGVGYYEHLYKPTGDWMESSYGNKHDDEKNPGNQKQLNRVMNRLRKHKKEVDQDIPEKDI